jgi:hypothetical protein
LERVQYNGLDGVFYKDKFEPWRTSLQAALWDKDLFSHLLNPKENIWMFEVDGSKRSEGSMSQFLVVTKDYPIEYFNMVAEGYVISDNLSKVKDKYGLEWNVSMKKDSDAKIKRYIHTKIKWLYNECFIPFEVMLNSFLKKMFSPY